MNAPDDAFQRRVERIMGKRPVAWRQPAGGYTPAQRWLASFEDGTSCFAKSATGLPDSPIDEWLRSEYGVYSRLTAGFLPRLLGWDDDGEAPLLILEDLSAARWPPPWCPGDVDAVLDMLARIHSTPLEVPPAELLDPDHLTHWREVQDNPEPFLSLGLCSRAWLDVALPALIAAAREVDLRGDDLVHFDVRSDNICFDGDRVLLIDWNFAARGNGELDIASWLPSLHSEGGPLPEEILPDAPQWAAVMSGFFAARAGGPPIPGAPRVREVQLSQLRSALPWAVRALDLSPLDGPNAP
jgi:Phosphotransferase enzyme family